jgi:transposase
LPKTIQNSWFSTKQSINPVAKNSQKTFSPLYTSSHAGKWEKEGIRALKIKLLPTKEQKQVFEKWAGTTRYVYNKCLEKIKLDPKLDTAAGYKKLCKECITEKGNNIVEENTGLDKFLYKWELDTPKDIRKGALRDIEKAYDSAWSNLKKGNINSFGLNYRRKKNGNEQSMEIPDTAIKVIKKKNKMVGVQIYCSKKYLPSIIKVDNSSIKGFTIDKITRAARLKKENNQWYLCISYDVDGVDQEDKGKRCAIDPGVRKFAVIYSEDRVTQIVPDQDKINKILRTMDVFRSLRDRKIIKQQAYNRKRCRLQSKLNNLIDDMHFKTINFLTQNYSNILLPSFEIQEMVSKRTLHRSTKRKMLNFSFYKFKQRLNHKAALLNHCHVEIVNEAYTSQTCGYCGNLKKTSDETITCDKCSKIFDRDINGARNIYLKYLK